MENNQNENIYSLYQKYHNQFQQQNYTIDDEIKAYQNQLAYIKQQDEERKRQQEISNAGFLKRAGATLLDIPTSVLKGINKGVEGIFDYGATLSAKRSTNKDTKSNLTRAVTYDRAGNNFQDIAKSSYIKDTLVGNVLESVGEMLPSIAVNAIPVIGTGASIATFGVSAGGRGVEQALQEGATLDKALSYGTQSAIAETGIELLSGGIGGLGKGLTSGLTKKLATKPLYKLGINMVGEGLEEVASELLRPNLESIYKAKDQISPITFESLLENFTLGALASGILQGVSVQAQGGFKNAKLNLINERMTTINNDLATLAEQGKLTDEIAIQYGKELTRLENEFTNELVSDKTIQIMQQEKMTQQETTQEIQQDTQEKEVTQQEPQVEQLDNDIELVQMEDGSYNLRLKDSENYLFKENGLKKETLQMYESWKNDNILANVVEGAKQRQQLFTPTTPKKIMSKIQPRKTKTTKQASKQTQSTQPLDTKTKELIRNPRDNKTIQEKVRSVKEKIQRAFTNSFATTEKYLYESKLYDFIQNNPNASNDTILKMKAKYQQEAETITNKTRTARSMAGHMATDGILFYSVDKQGNITIDETKSTKGLMEIFKGYSDEELINLTDYLYHKHNISRMAVEKPIFGEEVTVEDSQKEVAKYEKDYPQFIEVSKELNKYNQGLLQKQVDAGIISKSTMDYFIKTYPNYVPTHRYQKALSSQGFRKGSVQTGIYKAKGSDLVLLPIDEQIFRQTQLVAQAIAINPLLRELGDNETSKGAVEVVQKERITDISQVDMEQAPKRDHFSYLMPNEKGEIERITIRVDEGIADGIRSILPSMEDTAWKTVKKVSQQVNTRFKYLITSINPFFIARNFSRDMQNALFYTKYGMKTYLKNYGVAWKEIKSNGKYYQLFKAMGGEFSSIYNFQEEMTKKVKRTKIGKGIDWINKASMMVEVAPRLAEFISSLQNGNSVDQAIYDGADITINFGRNGSVTRLLNSTLMPFFNAKMQGALKFTRSFTQAKTRQDFLRLSVRLAMLGIIPSVINNLIYKDDEEYKSLRTSDKANNYLFKVGNKFIKLPKGQVFAGLSSIYNHMNDLAKGEDNALKGIGKETWQAFSPVESLRTIFSPIQDVKNNKTWYGGDIESQKFMNVRPRERYDESTSSIAIWIGKAVNYSPKKIHYLLDQYSGIIGDILLPATTKKYQANPIEKAFVLDPTTSNKYSTNFYDLLEEWTFDKTDGDTVASVKVRYMNKVKSQLNDLYTKQKEINASNLSDKEKKQQVETLQILINNTLKNGVINAKYIGELAENYELSETTFDDDYRELTRIAFGAEYALQNYNQNTYEKAQDLYSKGIDYDIFYCVYFDCKDMEGEFDLEGNYIRNSKANQVWNYINQLNISKAHKELLYESMGYKVKD